MRRVRRAIGGLVALALLAMAGLALVALTRDRKIAALGNDLPACRAQLDRAGVRYTILPDVKAG